MADTKTQTGVVLSLLRGPVQMKSLTGSIIELMQLAETFGSLDGGGKKEFVLDALEKSVNQLPTAEQGSLRETVTEMVPPLIDAICAVNKVGLIAKQAGCFCCLL